MSRSGRSSVLAPLRWRRHLVHISLTALALVAGCSEQSASIDPVGVPIAESARDTVLAGTPGAGLDPFSTPGLWVVDAQDQLVGRLVRRGSDDSQARSALYDRVQVYHPPSGLFFDVTMRDGRVLAPAKVYFKGVSCSEPLGVAVGACGDCRAGYRLAFLHEARWYEVLGGQPSEVIPNDASRDMGVSASCVPHSSSSTRAFPVDEVVGDTPPSAFSPPLRFHWQGSR